MNSKRGFYLLISTLIFAGLALTWFRHSHLNVPLWPGDKKPVWLIEARVDFIPDGQPILVSLALPDKPPGYTQVSEQAASPGYGFAIIEQPESRRAEWSIRHGKGVQTLYYNVKMIPSTAEADVLVAPAGGRPKAPTVFWSEPQSTAAMQLLNQAHERSSTPISFARELIKQVSSEPNQNAALLLSEFPLPVLLERLLNHAGIPARIAMGLELEDARRYQTLKPFLEIHDKTKWVIIDPRTGVHGLPENLLLWHRGEDSLLDVMGGSRSLVRFSMIRHIQPAMELSLLQFEKSGMSRLSLHRLPIEEQSVFKLLLLLPVGALVVTFMRIIVGVRTSGTFMPILIALAFMQTSLIPGLVAFVSIVSIGLVLRGYLSKLNLLLVARISTLIVLVIFLTSMLSILGHELGLNIGLTMTFFPMVIIAWTIERMSILWEEDGSREVMIQGLGSLFVAVAAYACMHIGLVGHLTFNFPEVHLVILALILMMGQYTSYKLSELKRFSVMMRDD
jgi:hypothetical protein